MWEKENAQGERGKEPAAAPVTAPAAQTLPTQAGFGGTRGPLFWLLVQNLALTLITVGIYRFWAKTRVRKFFWRHTRLLGDPLEYLGTGGELFIGFLIAIVVLVPLVAVYSLLQFFMTGMSGAVTFGTDIVYYAIIMFLVQIAIHRMRRYRLTRTAWRGVRFGLDGSSLKYALISFGYGLLSALTLGLSHPWLRVATMTYFVNHARFGTARLSLSASGRWLFRRWIVVGIPFAVAIGVFVASNWSVYGDIMELNRRAAGGGEVAEELQRALWQISYWPLAIIGLSTVIGVWYSVVEFRYLLGNVRIGDVSVSSAIGTGFVYRVYALYWLVLLVTACVSFGAVVGLSIALEGSFGGNEQVIEGIVGFVFVLLFFSLYGLFRTLFVDVALLKRMCATLTVSNADALDRVVQSTSDLPSHGEGMADALDVGGF